MKMNKVLRKGVKGLGVKLLVPIGGLLGLVVVAGLLVVQVVKKNPGMLGLLKGPEILKQEQEDFVAEVGKSISLPEEDPTVAEVTDLENLQGQVFFEKAVEGDKVLIYADARKVILYRPAEKRVVEVGTINVDRDGEGEVAGLATEALVVALLNGTETGGATEGVENKLGEVMPEAQIKVKTSAAKTDYDKSLVVDMTGEKSGVVETLARELGMEVGELPEGERERAGIEVVVIVGQDKLGD
jgi:hypothetical protein